MSEKKPALTIITESIPAYKVGEEYDTTIEVSGGTEPYTFDPVDGLPTGLDFNNGQIGGTPTESAGDVTIFITVRDAAGAHLTQAFDLQEAES